MVPSPAPSPHLAPLFVSHGAPDLVLEAANPTHVFLRGLGRSRPRPRAVLCVSAHWLAATATVETGARPQTIHDFGGFPPELYQRRYPAPGDPALAAEVQALLARSGIPNRGEARGFDHGVWVPLSLMYPEADVPVIALSLLAHGDPADHLALGRALSPLTDAGVLILASGGAIHNLGALGDGAAPAWALAFDQWLADTVAAGDHDALVHYRQRAPQAAMNHPTSEHFLPLLVACGAAGPQVVGRRLHQGFTYGSLGMAAFAWGKRD